MGTSIKANGQIWTRFIGLPALPLVLRFSLLVLLVLQLKVGKLPRFLPDKEIAYLPQRLKHLGLDIGRHARPLGEDEHSAIMMLHEQSGRKCWTTELRWSMAWSFRFADKKELYDFHCGIPRRNQGFALLRRFDPARLDGITDRFQDRCMKTCNTCGQLKPQTDFRVMNRAKLGPYVRPQCQECERGDDRKRSAAAYEVFRDWLAGFKSQLGCQICGETYSRALDFHHVDPATKTLNGFSMNYGIAWPRLVGEIRKCTLLCANCHRKVTYGAAVAPRPLDGSQLPVSDPFMARRKTVMSRAYSFFLRRSST